MDNQDTEWARPPRAQHAGHNQQVGLAAASCKLRRRHCQLHGKSLTDAFPSRQSDGVQMVKIQWFVKEQHEQELFLYCTNV